MACGGALLISTTTSGVQTGPLVYAWSGGAGITSSITVHQPGNYTVTVTNSKACSASANANVTYSNGATNTPSFTPPSIICVGRVATFINTSTYINGWNSTWDMGDGSGLVTTTNASHTYTITGLRYVVLTMDSAGCSVSTPATAHGVTVLSATNSLCLTTAEEVTFSNSIGMFPNPTNGNVNISVVGVEKNISIKVYNILGSEVQSFTSNDVSSSFNRNFDFSEFAGGTYLIKIQSGDKIAVKKLTINK
jgi:PKD repeat protein